MIALDVVRQTTTFRLEVAFENAQGITALFGRSGAGKSMTIGLIAGLIRPDRGSIRLGDRVLVDTECQIYVPMHRRRIGLVFQDSHLFPHFSVRRNLMFGRWFAPRRERLIGFDAVVDTLGIGPLLERRPTTLSGGERQRVAIGRALLSCPNLLLFDEPFAALDRPRRLEILPLIERLRDEFSIPIVYVSHAVEEVARLASRVVFIEAGRVKAIGDPVAVFGQSATQEGATRFERISVLAARVGAYDTAYGLSELRHPAGTIWLAEAAGTEGSAVQILVRATDVTLARERPRGLSVQSVLQGRLDSVEMDGPFAAIAILLKGGGRLFAMTTRRALDEMSLVAGDQVFALIKTAALDERTVAKR